MGVDIGELLPVLPGMIELPTRRSLHPKLANESQYPSARSSMISSSGAIGPPRVEVIDEMADVGSMLEELGREPFFSFATQAISVGGGRTR